MRATVADKFWTLVAPLSPIVCCVFRVFSRSGFLSGLASRRPRLVVASIRSLRECGDQDGLWNLFDRAGEFSPAEQDPVYRAFHRAFAFFGDDEAAARALTRAAGPYNRDAPTIWREAAAGDIEEARRRYSETVGRFVSPPALEPWVDCFDLLTGSDHDAERAARRSAEEHGNLFTRPVLGGPRLLAVSGMGWSGSGAVYGHLVDHESAAGVDGESRLIEGRCGLATLPVEPEPGDADFHSSLAAMFQYCLIGLAPCQDWEDYRHVRNARRASGGPRGDIIAEASLDALHALLEASPDDRSEVLHRWMPMLLEAATFAQVGVSDRVPVLDNVVHVGNLRFAQWLPDVLFFAVVRDPRDQFLDNVQKNPHYHGDVGRFIKRYRRSRRRLDVALSTTPHSVRAVHFEHFVRDPTYRAAVVGDVSRELGAITKPQFDPAASQRNIGFWKDSPHHEAVNAITEALPEFLVD